MGLAAAFRAPVVGLDVGSHSVKAVALRQGRRGWTLLAAGEMPIPPGEPLTQDQVGETVGGLLDTLDLHRAQIVSALSGQSVMVKRLALPAMNSADLAAVIPSEAEQYVPFPLEDVQLDYQVLRRRSALPAGALDVLLVAARRDRVAERLALIDATGCRPVVLDLEAFALANAYEVSYPRRCDAAAALIHVGRGATIVCLLENGQLAFTRDLSVGGATYLAALEHELGFEPAAAHRALHGSTDGGGHGVSPVLREVHLRLILEIRKTLDFYRSTAAHSPVNRIVLSGGACRIDGLGALLDAEFQTTVEWCDPFQEIVRPARAVGSDLDGPAFAVAVGLALRREGDR